MPAATLDPAELLTRRDCAQIGAALFAAVVVAAYALAWLILGIWYEQFTAWIVVRQLLIAAYIGVPLAAVSGLLLGAECHRLAMDTLAPSYLRLGFVWLVMLSATAVMLLVFRTFFVLIFFQPALARAKGIGRWLLPMLYAVIYALCIVVFLLHDPTHFPKVLALGAFVGIYLADAILVESITDWRDERRLAHGTSQLQYSLKTLLFGLLILGAWASGAVLLLRN